MRFFGKIIQGRLTDKHGIGKYDSAFLFKVKCKHLHKFFLGGKKHEKYEKKENRNADFGMGAVAGNGIIGG